MLPFHLVQSANNEFLFMKTHRVLNRLSKCENVRYCENQVLLWFTINSQSKLKKIQYAILKISTKKNSLWNLIRFQGGFFELEIPESFTKGFLLKTIIWTWIFFKHCTVLSLKRNKKSSLKRCESSKNCLTVDTAGDRSKTLKNRKTKTKNEKKSNNSFLLLTFFI